MAMTSWSCLSAERLISYDHSAHDSPSLHGVPSVEFGEVRRTVPSVRKRDDQGAERSRSGDAIGRFKGQIKMDVVGRIIHAAAWERRPTYCFVTR